jgi:thiosulfate/3-mercaptopyruvate sulfurtransferase
MLQTLTAALLLALPADEPAKSYPRPELLVEPAELAKWANEAKVRVLDARSKEQYAKGHVPGAAWVDHDDWSRAFAKSQDFDEWSKRLDKIGIDPGTRVVVYDDNLSKDAARIWWILRYWGVKDVRLLNGGWKGWLAAAGDESTDAPAEVKRGSADFTAQKPRLTTKDDLLKMLKDRPPQIIDARSTGEFCGDEASGNKRAGAVPGAVHLEWSDLLDKKSGRFKSADELAKLFKDAGIDPTKPAVTYCQSGGRASVMAFALELMGGKDVRNYYRSWAEWGNDDATPIVKPKK